MKSGRIDWNGDKQKVKSDTYMVMDKNSGTKEILEAYFATQPAGKVAKLRGQIDRPELYAYEKRIGKSIFEMNADELFSMIQTFKNNKFRRNDGDSYSIPYNTYTNLASLFRAVFNYYIDTVKIIKNPFNDPTMRGQKAMDRLCNGKSLVTKEKFNQAIIDLHNSQDPGLADYIECIMRMYYEGFFNAACIVNMKENDIDFTMNKIYIADEFHSGKISVSYKVIELLQKIHSATDATWIEDNLKCTFIPYRGSYFKFSVKQREAGNYDNRDVAEVKRVINRYISRIVNVELGYQFNYRNIYLLGFYDYMVERFGEKRTRDVIKEQRNSENISLIRECMSDYGLYFYDNPAATKRALNIFL